MIKEMAKAAAFALAVLLLTFPLVLIVPFNLSSIAWGLLGQVVALVAFFGSGWYFAIVQPRRQTQAASK